MRRRRFITTLGGAVTIGLAGCVTPGERRHPFANETVSVRIDAESDTSHDVTDITRRSLDYWEDHSESYAGFPIRFEIVTEEADMTIRFVDRPDDCQMVANYSDRVLGCAPVIRPGQRLPRTVRAIVVAGARPPGKIRITTKHELGHVLGLGHDDEPQEIMSTDPRLRIPQYALRIDVWETIVATQERAANATVLFSHAIETWDDDNYAGAEAAFLAAKTDYDTALTQLRDARDRTEEFAGDQRVETVDLEGLRRHLDRLIERMRLAVAVTAAMVSASAGARRSDHQAVDEHRSTANARIDEFNRIRSPEMRDIAIALGLVRGFDRDEPVIDVDEDEIER